MFGRGEKRNNNKQRKLHIFHRQRRGVRRPGAGRGTEQQYTSMILVCTLLPSIRVATLLEIRLQCIYIYIYIFIYIYIYVQ